MPETVTKTRKPRIWPSIVLIAVFTLSVGVSFSYLAEEYARFNEYSKLKSSVTSLAASFDPNQVASLSGSSFDEGTQSFDIIRGQLKRIKSSSPRNHFVYLMGKTGDDIYFIADAEEPGSEDYSAPGDIYNEASEELHQIFKDGVGFVEGPIVDKWGRWVSGSAAIRNHKGEVIAILGFDVDADEWTANIANTRYVGLLLTFLLSSISVMLFALMRQGRRTNTALRESARNVQAFLDSTPDALIILDDQGSIIQTNDEIDAVFGYKAENLIRKPLKDLIEPADYDRLVELWTEYFDKGKIEANFSALEFNGVKSSGEVFPMALRLSRFTSNGKTYSCGIFRDISERKAYDLRIAGIREEADAANRAKSQYIAGMSHELRTPLNVIIGYSELMQNLPDHMTDEKRSEYLEHVVKSGRHMLELVGQVLDIAKVESGETDIELSEVDIHPLARQCLSMIQPMADAADLKTNLEAAPSGLPHVLANPVQLKQVLLNLLSNAVKYNEPGGAITASIEASANNIVKLAVSDTGTGIPADKIGEIFTPYNRLDHNDDEVRQGHGIGLNITKSLVEGMGGVIGFENNADKGSTFWIELTAASDMDSSTPAQQEG